MNNILLITGASSDIGLRLIKQVLPNTLILAHYYSSEEKLLKLQSEIRNTMVLLRADLAVEEDVHHLIEQIELEHGIPNQIVHLASAPVKNIRFKDIGWIDFEREINISLRSVVMILNRFAPKMASSSGGKIVFMLSSYTMGVPPKALAHYNTVKYALKGLAKSLASEFGHKKIMVNSVSPSMIETRFLANLNEKIVELNAYNHPLKRNATVEDVVPTILFLLSKDADYINGIDIPITGGSTF